MNLLFLMKDYSVIRSDDIEKYYKAIQFILFPCDPELGTYLLMEPNQYMVKMKKAKIIIESVAERCGYDYRDHYHPIGRIEKIVYTYEELIQYLFSIEKTKYFNNVMLMSDVEDIPPYMKIMFCFFSIRLYDEKNKVIFKKKINVGEEVTLSEIYISKIFGVGNILNNIRDVYFQEVSLFKEHISIDPIKNRWDLGHDDYMYALCMYWFDDTCSVRFFYKDQINKFEKIQTLYAQSSTFKADYTDGIVMWNYPEYDLLYVEPHHAIEYITYLPYINLVMKACTIAANKSPGNHEIVETDIEISSRIEIEVNGKIITKRFNDTNPFTIDDVLNLLEDY